MQAVAAISQSALAHNLAVVSAHAPQAKVVGMVKSDAYGHHLDLITPLFTADILAVSELSEARRLRSLTQKPILLLSGVFTEKDLQEAIQLNCHLVFHDLSQLAILMSSQHAVKLWIKIDTGMHRLGIAAQSLSDVLSQIDNHKHIQIECIMSHFACADEPMHPKNTQQLDFFNQLDTKDFYRSMANSAAIMSQVKSQFDYVRPGIMLYGASPFANIDEQLMPVMELSAPILSTKTIKAGEAVGYGATWKADKDTRIAIIGIGYGDGYPRHAKNGTPVLINGTLCTLVGRVSMDLICVDIKQTNAQIGDRAILWGNDKLRVETVALHCQTIAYELLTGVSTRVTFTQRA
ncbi:MAG: alanine racemase [Proteobacteria bacterium]|nr:alanine racemase [Pseudomonadota bacterium]MCH9749882.1 alanine racemase [Pseudomonadota bacterium]